MQKNWYIVYTKVKSEKKVATTLSKKKIENFCPLNKIKTKSFRRNKILFEPLFQAYVFVHISENEIPLLKQVDGIISLLHWMGKPAIINKDEIDVIKDFAHDYQNIELEKAQVNPDNLVSMVDSPSYSIDGNIFTLKNKVMKVYLPSLGLVMAAKVKEDSFFTKETIFIQSNSFLHL